MLLMELPKIMIVCLLMTIILESIISFLIRIKDKQDYLNIILVNILTNPILVTTSSIIRFNYGLSIYKIYMIILEIIVIIVEGFIYKKYIKYNRINPYLLSLILNLSSYILGFIINPVIWN